MLDQLSSMACGSALKPCKELIAEPLSEMGVDQNATHGSAAVQEGSADLRCVLWLVEHQWATTTEDL